MCYGHKNYKEDLTMAFSFNIPEGKRAERKEMATIARWTDYSGAVRTQILGVRTEDASMEFNHDVQQSTDIRGINYTDVNKTQPQMSMDPFYLMAGSPLAEFLTEANLRNDIQKYTNCIDIYTVLSCATSGGGYVTRKDANCTIIATAMGGDAYVNMPINVYYSNEITMGTINVLSDNFTFTAEGASGKSYVAITATTTQSTFTEGGYIDGSKITVSAVTSTGTKETISTGFTFAPARALTVDDKNITVTYGNFSTSIPITVTGS